MKIFTAQQLKALDVATMKAQNVSSFELVERAGSRVTERILEKYPQQTDFVVIAGVGKNGADGVVIARKLIEAGKNCEIVILNYSKNHSPELLHALEKLNMHNPKLAFVNDKSKIGELDKSVILIEAIMGAGLNRALTGLLLESVEYLNTIDVKKKVSIDLPAGLSADGLNFGNSIFRADETFTFELPKLSLMLASNYNYTGEVEIIKIDLDQEFINSTKTNYNLLDKENVKKYLPLKRGKFSHKGDYGHVLIVAGSKGKTGAAVLSAKSALRTGSGLVTTYTPKASIQIVQTAIPEAMNKVDKGENYIENYSLDSNDYNTVAVGSGIGTGKKSTKALTDILKATHKPMVIDADAITILGKNLKLMELVPKKSIFTPHPGEFDRLVGESSSSINRLEKQVNFATRYGIILVLKGAHTSIVLPSGKVYFNSTGNPAMATAGMGDVLTGVIASLLGQGLKPHYSALLGVYLHGLAGDLTAGEWQLGILANELADRIPTAFNELSET